MLGHDEGTILPLPATLPLMLAVGTRDGVIANSAHRYGGMRDPVQATFENGVRRDCGDCYLVEIEGANHFSIARPVDRATGRQYLDEAETGDGDRIRKLLAKLLGSFIADTLHGGHGAGAPPCRTRPGIGVSAAADGAVDREREVAKQIPAGHRRNLARVAFGVRSRWHACRVQQGRSREPVRGRRHDLLHAH